MTIDILLQTFVSGLSLGGVYALVAIGLTLIYGVMYIVNFAQTDFLMLGMYFSYWFYVLFGFDPYLSVFLAAITFFILGALLQWGFISRILDAQPMNQILLTLGLSSVLIGGAQMLWRTDPRSINLAYSTMGFRLGEVIFNYPRTIAFITSVVSALILYLFLERTRLGKAIRACSQSRSAAKLMGIDVDKMFIITFGIGIALSAVAGVMLSPSVPVNPNIGQNYSVTTFVIVVLGTLGNFWGAFLGGLIIGVAESFGGLLISGAMKQVVSMAIFIIVLLFRPQGLFGGSK